MDTELAGANRFFAQFLRIFRVIGHVSRLKLRLRCKQGCNLGYNKRFCIDTESVNTLFYQNAPSSCLF
jgi:hypothetical protein